MIAAALFWVCGTFRLGSEPVSSQLVNVIHMISVEEAGSDPYLVLLYLIPVNEVTVTIVTNQPTSAQPSISRPIRETGNLPNNFNSYFSSKATILEACNILTYKHHLTVTQHENHRQTQTSARFASLIQTICVSLIFTLRIKAVKLYNIMILNNK